MARRTATSYRGRGAQVATADSDASTTNGAQEADSGMGLAEGLILATTVLLFAAILLTDAYLGKRYGGGVFFK